jgi:hypothetical protein
LHDALAAAGEQGLPEIQISPIQGKMLQVLAATCNAQKILEALDLLPGLESEAPLDLIFLLFPFFQLHSRERTVRRATVSND